MRREIQLEPLRGGGYPTDSDPLLHEHHHVGSSLLSASASSSEIEVVDIKAGSLPSCRICLHCDGKDGVESGMCSF
ncbi:hypothetical protein ACH5RR_004274 [Cinchona calisaya]|uniref:Uncharacterized protein n=1 Tax=Cinchona calisaya TaxID=153742 RepID=A0ABD3AXG5_9GENT